MPPLVRRPLRGRRPVPSKPVLPRRAGVGVLVCTGIGGTPRCARAEGTGSSWEGRSLVMVRSAPRFAVKEHAHESSGKRLPKYLENESGAARATWADAGACSNAHSASLT
jgi:hypothetical protein